MVPVKSKRKHILTGKQNSQHGPTIIKAAEVEYLLGTVDAHVSVCVFHPRCFALEENGRKRNPAGWRKISDTGGGSGASPFTSAETTLNICTAAVTHGQ